MPKSAMTIAISSSAVTSAEQLVDEPRLLLAERRLVLHLDVREVLGDGRRRSRLDLGERRPSAPFTSTNASSCSV